LNGPPAPAGRPAARPPGGLLGMLAMVAAVEAAIAGHRPDLARPWAEDWRVAARAAVEKAPGCRVLCLGDSLVKHGVLPRAIEARTGLRAYGLAIGGGTVPAAYFLLRRAIGSGARPGAVVVDFAALMLDDPDPTPMLNYPELADLRDGLDLAWTARDPGFFAAFAAGHLLPSCRWRFEIRDAVRAALGGVRLPGRRAILDHRRIWDREAGGQALPTGRDRPPGEDALIDGVSPASWSIGPTDRAYLERFLALAGSRGVAVFWLLPPLCPEAHARRARRGSDAAYDRLAREVLAGHPHVVVLDARDSGYDDSVHRDHIHLDRRGAAVLTADVGSIVADRLAARSAGPRWVELPAYAGRAGDEPPPALARSPGPTSTPRSAR